MWGPALLWGTRCLSPTGKCPPGLERSGLCPQCLRGGSPLDILPDKTLFVCLHSQATLGGLCQQCDLGEGSWATWNQLAPCRAREAVSQVHVSPSKKPGPRGSGSIPGWQYTMCVATRGAGRTESCPHDSTDGGHPEAHAQNSSGRHPDTPSLCR